MFLVTLKNEYLQMHYIRYLKTLNFLPQKSFDKVLDIGGYDGVFAGLLLKKHPESTVYVTDIEIPNINHQNDSKIIFKKCSDLNIGKLPFKNEFFDVVTCLEVIEHLHNPDNLIKEIYRVLKPGGVLILSTPNLASLTNRLLLLLGYFPISISISLKSEITGKRDILTSKNKDIQQAMFDYHIRAYTFSALKVLLELHGYKITRKRYIHGYYNKNPLFNVINKFIEKFVPPLAQCILIEAKKQKSKIYLE